MMIPRRKLFTKRQIAKLDACWWSMARTYLRMMKENIRSNAGWSKDNRTRLDILDEYDEALRWFVEMRRGKDDS
jgi:hypothetical protein